MEYKATTSERLKQIISERNLKQADILAAAKPYCKQYGIKLNKSDLSQFVNGKVEPGQWKLTILGLALNVSETWLMGLDVPMERNTPVESQSNILQFPNVESLPKMKQIPLLGAIACGEPILAEENFDGMVQVPAGIDADYALRCKGDSMINARIMDGDLVFVRQQPDVDNGEIAAVLIDNEATLKRVYKHPDSVILQPENPQYSPFVYTGAQLQDVHIIGKAVYFMSKVK
ncbi:MAG: repressor LexA [Ruminococcaceae bacterium]|nr:repressor LexA [Oscillospiraceae bacterium]